MTPIALLFPVLLQVLLTFVILVLMGRARARSMRDARQTLTDPDVMLGRNAWNEQATKTANSYRNQFELPVLFYAACGFALVLKQADPVMIGLAWVFALTRVLHAIVHIGPNVIKWRGATFILGAMALLGMWLVFAYRVGMGG